MFDAVDALLAAVDDGTVLPAPAERQRLVEASSLTLAAIAQALGTRTPSVQAWQEGRSEPKGDKREAYRRLLEGLAARYPAPPTGTPAPTPAVAPVGDGTEPDLLSTASEAASPISRETGPRPAVAPATGVGERYANGPLLVLDGDGHAYAAGGLVLACPVITVAELVEWTLAEARIGQPRLHPAGKDGDPLVVLTASAAEYLGLPDRLEDRRSLRLSADHPVVKQLDKAKWQLTKRGFGPWARIYRPAEAGRRQCVQLAVLPWDALDTRAWGDADQLPAPELARLLADFASRVITPRGSMAVTGLELMTALRPPTRAARDHTSGGWVSAPVPGSLTTAVDPAPPEAPDEHPVAQHRPAHLVLDEEACEWIRDPELLTDTECALPFAVGVDVNMAFAAAANRLPVGLGAPEHITRPRFDKTIPGTWLVDLSHIDLDPRLPNPFTPHGTRPDGPACYTTPTVAYALELGYDVHPLEAWLRPDRGPYLDPWYQRLRDAYLATMGDLGVTPDLTPAQFLAAMDGYKDRDPGQAMVLSAIKATVKGGIGKLRERPQGVRHRAGERWPALERPTWRPDIRAAVISAARINMHRKIHTLATKAGLYPLAVLSDCVVYPSPGPSPLDVLPYNAAGKPLPGGFRLGVNPGMVKHEGTQPLLWAAQLLDQGHNPARHIKGGNTRLDGE